jgi:pimeloyl-ACP methyl ester carboxylesterase/DNA-binding winged helix-turn-helix (wHTH) protein
MRTAVSFLDPAHRAPLRQIAFGHFLLDLSNELLTSNGNPVRLRPKTFAMLAHLVASAGQLVTKEELLDALWPGVFVGDAALKTCVREIRDALGDDARRPGYIETAHRRGYRFIAPVVATDGDSPETPSIPPTTLYARLGDANIAYQVVGDGPIDLVLASGWVSHLDYMWAEPSFNRFLVRLASLGRLILFDARGTGLSDQLPYAYCPEQRTQDLHALLDRVGSRRAALVGVSDGGPICGMYAARYPEQTIALVMLGAYAKGAWAADYPWGQTPEQEQELVESILRDWGGPVGIDERAPSRAGDVEFRTWWSTYLRLGASPAAAVALARMNADLDVREELSAISVPTLVLHRSGDRVMPAAGARYIAERIASARLVELSGDDHLPFVGDQDAIVDEIKRFLALPADRAA